MASIKGVLDDFGVSELRLWICGFRKDMSGMVSCHSTAAAISAYWCEEYETADGI